MVYRLEKVALKKTGDGSGSGRGEGEVGSEKNG